MLVCVFCGVCVYVWCVKYVLFVFGLCRGMWCCVRVCVCVCVCVFVWCGWMCRGVVSLGGSGVRCVWVWVFVFGCV